MAVVETLDSLHLQTLVAGTLPDSAGERSGLTGGDGLVAVAAADDDTSKYVVGIIPSNLKLSDIDIHCTAITGGTDYDLGLYDIDYTSSTLIGTVVDADCFMDGQTMATASGSDSGVAKLSGLSIITTANRGKYVWEYAGASVDPGKDYLLVYTANTVGTAAGTIYTQWKGSLV